MRPLKRSWHRVPKLIRQSSVAVVGLIVTLAGVAMLALPGPGILVIFLGLAILSTEFIWAKTLRDWASRKFKDTLEAAKQKQRKHRK